jgi:hypothetical protein
MGSLVTSRLSTAQLFRSTVDPNVLSTALLYIDLITDIVNMGCYVVIKVTVS